MPFTIDIRKYPECMKGMIGRLTTKAAGIRRRNAQSVNTHDVVVTNGADSITLILNERDLYILGFRNAHGTFRFNDHMAGGATMLPIGCSYTQADGLGILRDRTSPIATTNRGYGQLYSAIQRLSEYRGGAVGDGMKANLGLMVYLVSESLRFKPVFRSMCTVCKGTGTVSFAQYRDHVTNWSTVSGGGVVPGVARADLSTAY